MFAAAKKCPAAFFPMTGSDGNLLAAVLGGAWREAFVRGSDVLPPMEVGSVAIIAIFALSSKHSANGIETDKQYK